MAVSFYHGFAHRFCVRPFVTRWNDVQYMVCDADWVTDADFANGHSSPVVAQFPSTQMCVEWMDGVEAGAYESIPHESNFEGWPELKGRVAAAQLCQLDDAGLRNAYLVATRDGDMVIADVAWSVFVGRHDVQSAAMMWA